MTRIDADPPGAGLSRRAAAGRLALAGLGIAGCGLGPGPAEAAATGSFALAPDYRRDWAAHDASALAQVVQLARGVRLDAGPNSRPDRDGLAIWSRNAVSGNFVASFTTRRTDDTSPPSQSGLYLLFYFGVQGDGTPGHPARLADWSPSTNPYTHAYAQHIRGARISLHRQSGVNAGDSAPLEAAFFKADGSRNQLGGDTEVPFANVRNVAYSWTIRRAGNTVTVTQRGGGASRTVRFTNAGFGRYAVSGSLGFLVPPGRDVEVTGFRVSGG